MKNQNDSPEPLPTLLVVDDENAIQKILTFYFKNTYRVVTCNNGRDALAWLYQGNMPRFIVADINMPVLNGMEFLKEIKSSGLYAGVPLLFLSGNDSSDTRIACLEAGADDFMIKPFNPRELQARMNTILRRSLITSNPVKW
jgi:DNA-binding response OmpR family regulator